METHSDLLPPMMRRRRPRPGFVRVALLFVTSALVAHALLGERGLLALLRAQRAQAELATAIEGLRRTNSALGRYAVRLRHDPAAIETLARRELGMIRPGELLVIFREAEVIDPPGRMSDGGEARPAP